jgi:hypothetical protein
MDPVEATQRMALLEARFHELNRAARETQERLRAVAQDDRDAGSSTLLRTQLAETESEMQTILREAARVEDSLLE